MKDIPLSGSEIVQPILNDSLAFLKNNPQEDCKQIETRVNKMAGTEEESGREGEKERWTK